ncbi:Molybdenum cofactor biosynthesis protein large subunit [Planctomycetales bacterium 10988]|nr:Molybdenum cofactor biosynthesis protein large subunit [Planctomycetales bacterium 10988]
MVELTEKPIDTEAILQAISDTRCGAALLFLGNVREWTGDQQTNHLVYEAYRPMAEAKMKELEAEARRRWEILQCSIVHRLGKLELGEASVAVAVSSPHRRDAFEAGQWLIDTLKEVVPIWKQEVWADGSAEWVHPENESNPTPESS